MNNTYFIYILLLFFSSKNFAQNGNANINAGNTTREALMGRSGYTNPLSTEGTAYLYAEYKKAKIANNTTLVDMRYNAYKDEVEIINNGQNMTIYKRPEYSPIHIIDSNERLYLLEYPYDGKKVTGYLFEVKKNDELTIFIKISKTYNKGSYAQDSFDKDKDNVYEDLDDVFYVQRNNGEILQIPNTKKKLIEMFPEKKNKIERTIKESKLDTKKIDVVTQIMTSLLS